MLIDDVTIRVKAGHGGKGAVAFQRIKLALGPTGSSGGRGGSVYLEAVADIGALRRFHSVKEFAAENGKNGRTKLVDGKSGSDITLPVPVGTVVHNLELTNDRELTKIGEKILVAKGGLGGKGNYHFRSSTNTSPQEFQPGLPGESFTLHLELKLIADVGIVGLPNVGKSTLLNALTNASSKVANYPFTTLEPNLGAYYSLILADIPGLIEGASSGKGLGIKFLRHIERTKMIFHLVSAESDDVARDYKIVRGELEAYSKQLALKEEWVFLTKTDLVSSGQIEIQIRELKKIAENIAPVSPDNMEPVKNVLAGLATRV